MKRNVKTDEEQKLVDEWLAKGNEVTVCDPGDRTDPTEITVTWGKKKKVVVASAAPKK
jgi:hypothetical protein